LPDKMIDDMRKRFEESEEYISTLTSKVAVNLEKVRIESLLTLAKFQGFTQEEIDLIRETAMKSETPSSDKVIELLKSGSAGLHASFTSK